MALIFILLAILILYLLSLRGRKGHPGWAQLSGWYYAHRGLHNSEKPENSMAAFRAALEKGYGIELDIHLLKDGNLAVMHDSKLLRTTGAQGRIEDLTTGQLSGYRLAGTDETIPTFRQVLELYAGKAPLIVELKCVDSNYAQLTQTACDMLAEYPGPYCLESFDPRCIRWLRKHRPELIRGQLSENYFRSQSPVPGVLKFLLTHQLMNFLLLPDFVAYRFADRKNLGSFFVQKLWGVKQVTWTLRSRQDFDTALGEDLLPIFENFTP